MLYLFPYFTANFYASKKFGSLFKEKIRNERRKISFDIFKGCCSSQVKHFGKSQRRILKLGHASRGREGAHWTKIINLLQKFIKK